VYNTVLILYRTYFPHEDFKPEPATASTESNTTAVAASSSLPQKEGEDDVIVEAETKGEEAKDEPAPEPKIIHKPTADTIGSSSDIQSPVAKEPSSKKIKLSTTAATDDDLVKVSEPASAVSGTSDEWVEIDKSSIPQKATVEDAEDE
jgi:hypothetical protein